MPDQLESKTDKPLFLSRWDRWCLKRGLNSWMDETQTTTVYLLLDKGEAGLRLLFDLMDESARTRRYIRYIVSCWILWYFFVHGEHYWFQVFGFTFTLINLQFPSRSHVRALDTAAYTLSKRGDMRFVPLILKYWMIGSSGADAEGKALALLLPQMKLKDSTLLTSEHRKKLNRHLLFAPIKRRVKTTDLRLAILKAYEQVGDASSLVAVEELLTKNIDAKLRDAAETCCLYLRQNIGRVSEVQTLLRASALPDKPEELLRPAREKREEEPLLRPAIPPRDSENE